MNVLMVAACPFPTSGGTQVLIDEMAKALCVAGTRVELATFGIGVGDLEAHDRRSSYRVWRARRVPFHQSVAAGPSVGRPAADAALTIRCLQVARAARRDGPAFDVVHGHNYEGAFVGAVVARAMGIPLLYHAHNLMGDELETYFEGRLLRGVSALLGRALDRRVPRLADQCVSVSRHTQARLIELTGAPVAYQPPAVEYGERSGSPVASDVVYAGNMDGYQGIELLDEALQRLPLLRCTVVSRAPWCGRAQVHWVRERSFAQVKAHLEGARLAVLPRCVPSGFPVKLINYLYAGLPVVACQSGAQGLGIDDGVVVVPDGDATGFASAIDRLLEDPPRRELLAQRAAEAAKRFSWASHVAELEQMYRDVVAGAQKRPAAGQESAQQRVWSEGVT